MAPRCPIVQVALALGWLVGWPVAAQSPGDAGILRAVHETRSERLSELEADRREAALGFVAVAREVLSVPDAAERRREVLGAAQELADRVVSLDGEIAAAGLAVRESRHRLASALEAAVASHRRAACEADPGAVPELDARIRALEVELARLGGPRAGLETPDPLASAAPVLVALAGVVAEEHGVLLNRHRQRDEVRLFLSDLRLFDRTAMRPSSRAGGGDPDPGCPPTACSVSGFTPVDVPVTHIRPDDAVARDGAGAPAVTPASLARLQEQIAGFTGRRESALVAVADRVGTVTRETVVAADVMAFRDAGAGARGAGPRVSTSFLLTRPLGGLRLTVEPSVGGRAVRVDPITVTELAGEVRETLAGESGYGRSAWQVSSWQKGRFVSGALPPPGYLEPGRVEAGLAGRLALPLRGRWDAVLGGGGDVARYAPADWRVLDRQGVHASIGGAWHGESNTGRISVTGSRHGFPHPASQPERREDARLGVEGDVSFEGAVVTRVSAGLAWNDSRLPAYRFRSARAAVVTSVPWRSGSVQVYAALAHQTYPTLDLDETRVAPSEHDAGALVVVQYTLPLDGARSLVLRGDWSRSESGIRNEFFDRFGLSVRLALRGTGGG